VEQLPCPDGFVIDSDDPLRQAHEQINFWIVEMEEAASKRPYQQLCLEAKDLKKSLARPRSGSSCKLPLCERIGATAR
jgi:hypothetical protein